MDDAHFAARAAQRMRPAIGRVHVETWQSSYAGLLPDALLVAMSDVRQSAWWSPRALDDPPPGRAGIFVADDDEMGVVGFTSGGADARHARGPRRRRGAGWGRSTPSMSSPTSRNRGLGRALLDALFGQFVADGYDTAILWMLAENPTRFFYEAAGAARVVGGAHRTPLAGADCRGGGAYAWRDLETTAGSAAAGWRRSRDCGGLPGG